MSLNFVVMGWIMLVTGSILSSLFLRKLFFAKINTLECLILLISFIFAVLGAGMTL